MAYRGGGGTRAGVAQRFTTAVSTSVRALHVIRADAPAAPARPTADLAAPFAVRPCAPSMRACRESDPDILPQELLRKYISYSKQNCRCDARRGRCPASARDRPERSVIRAIIHSACVCVCRVCGQRLCRRAHECRPLCLCACLPDPHPPLPLPLPPLPAGPRCSRPTTTASSSSTRRCAPRRRSRTACPWRCATWRAWCA